MARIINIKETPRKNGEQEANEKTKELPDLIKDYLQTNSAAAKDSISAIEDGRDFFRDVLIHAGTLMNDTKIGNFMEMTTQATAFFGEPLGYIIENSCKEGRVTIFNGKDGDTEYNIHLAVDEDAWGSSRGHLSYAVFLFKTNHKERLYEIFTNDGWKPCEPSDIYTH